MPAIFHRQMMQCVVPDVANASTNLSVSSGIVHAALHSLLWLAREAHAGSYDLELYKLQ